MKPTGNPNPSATCAMRASSVDTCTTSNRLDARAVWRICEIIGRPPKSRMFLFGIRLEPPRAGTMAIRVGAMWLVRSVSGLQISPEYRLDRRPDQQSVHAASLQRRSVNRAGLVECSPRCLNLLRAMRRAEHEQSLE